VSFAAYLSKPAYVETAAATPGGPPYSVLETTRLFGDEIYDSCRLSLIPLATAEVQPSYKDGKALHVARFGKVDPEHLRAVEAEIVMPALAR